MLHCPWLPNLKPHRHFTCRTKSTHGCVLRTTVHLRMACLGLITNTTSLKYIVVLCCMFVPKMGLVSQDCLLFHGTIEDNIRYGTEQATSDQVVEAAKAAYAHEFILAMPYVSHSAAEWTQIASAGVHVVCK